jgi:hypothetical protein
MSFKNLSLSYQRKRKDADSDKAPAKPSSSRQPVSPLSNSGTKERSEKHGLFFLNQQQFEDFTKAGDGEARYSVDIVALHGINGDAYDTWTHRNGKLWLRDFLAPQLPGARVFSFGYRSEVAFTLATGQLGDFARSLLEQLNYIRRTAEVRQYHPGYWLQLFLLANSFTRNNYGV